MPPPAPDPTRASAADTCAADASEDASPAARLFVAHHAALYRYLVRLTGDADQAADAAQEAFVRAMTPGVLPAPHGTNEHDAQRAWLFRVATRVALDESRTAGRRRRLVEAAPERAPMADAPPDAHATVEARERHAYVAAALATLPVRDRTALLLREAGFAHREIAAALDTTTGAVGTVLARAVTRLAAALRATVPGGPEAV